MSSSVGWKRGQLGQECSIEIGGTPSRNVAEYWDKSNEANIWVSIRDLDKRIIVRTAESITDSGVKHSNAKLQPEGTVLLSFKLSIGRVAIAGCPLYTNEAIAGLRSDSVIHDYIYHGLKQWDLLQGVDQAIKGATLNKKKLKLIEFDFPIAKSEQAKIAEILSKVDQAIEQTEAMIAKQESIKTGLMQDLLTRGIDDNGNLRSESTHQFKDSPLGCIPADWEAAEMWTACSYITKGTTPKDRSKESLDFSIPYLRVQNITFKGDLDLSAELDFISRETHIGELSRSRVFPGDVLQNIVGPPLGKIAIVPSDYPEWNINQAIAVFRPNGRILSRFLCEFLQAPFARGWFEMNSKKTSGQQNLTLEQCEHLPLVLPPPEEQRRICLVIERASSMLQIDRRSLSGLLSLKVALMQDLLTGRKRVTPLLELEIA